MNQQNIGKIFIVDDDPFWSSILEQLLKNNGYSDIHQYSSGTACLENLHLSPGLVLLDHSMDTLNGLEVLRKIKRVNPDISVVFISSQEDLEVAVSSLKYGAFDYIVKGKNEQDKLPAVLKRLAGVNTLLAKQKHGFFKKILSIN